jgi:hypothetical protein
MTIRMILLPMATNARAEDATTPSPFDASQYPPEVRKALHDANDECAGRRAVYCGSGSPSCRKQKRITATHFPCKIPD